MDNADECTVEMCIRDRQELPKQEIVVKDSGNDQNIYQKNSVAEVEIQQKPEVLKVLLRTDENVEISVQMENCLLYTSRCV